MKELSNRAALDLMDLAKAGKFPGLPPIGSRVHYTGRRGSGVGTVKVQYAGIEDDLDSDKMYRNTDLDEIVVQFDGPPYPECCPYSTGSMVVRKSEIRLAEQPGQQHKKQQSP